MSKMRIREVYSFTQDYSIYRRKTKDSNQDLLTPGPLCFPQREWWVPHLERRNWTLIIKGRGVWVMGLPVAWKGAPSPAFCPTPSPCCPYCQQDFFGAFSQCLLEHRKKFSKFTQTNLHVFSDSIGSNVPMTTLLSVFGSCPKLLDIFSYKILK